MSSHVVEGAQRTNLTVTGTIPSQPGANLLGIFVASTSSGTIKVADTAGTIANTFTPAAATFYPLPCSIQGTLTITLANTIDCTVFWVPA